ncbi:MAG: CYTH and CHAD domain-containing protein [Actinomycetota bacterium]|nr:CYTH and CHAD domain-containing protein [Actinomycetota bacterium]
MRRSTEREAKFEGATAVAVPDLTGVSEGSSEIKLPTVTLTATYYDTEDLRLLRRHLTLRHRSDDVGSEDEWTLKVPGDTKGSGLRRMELTWPGPTEQVPADAVALTAAIIRGAALQPVAELVTVRRRRELRASTGRRLAEIDDDEVTGTDLTPAGDHDAAAPLRFREVEIELDGDDDDILDRAGHRLVASGFVRSAEASKLARVLADRVDSRAPRPAPGHRSTIEAVVVASIADGLERLVAHDLAIRTDGDPRSVHQARVATRRLRADLLTFASLLDPVWVRRTRTTLKWVADALGDVRDADVLAERLVAHRSEIAEVDADGFDVLVGLLSGERRAAMVNLRDILDRPRYLEVLGQLEEATVSPSWKAGTASKSGRRASKVLGRLARRPWRKLRRTVEGLGEDPENRDLHQVRIKAKQVRYAAELAGPVVGSPATRLARSTKALQGTLGDHNDAVNAEAWLRRAAADQAMPVVVTAGQLIARERQLQAVTTKAWSDDWKKVSRKSTRCWMQ